MATRLIIEPTPGFDPPIGQLVSMLAYTRATTLDDVAGLDRAGLDHRLDDQANSIGMILEHIAAVEEHYQIRTFGLALAGEAEQRHRLGLRITDASHETFRNRPLEACLERLAAVRERTLTELARRDDAWLYERSEQRGRESNNYFWWFHVIEEEISHRGQIRILRKRLPGG